MTTISKFWKRFRREDLFRMLSVRKVCTGSCPAMEVVPAYGPKRDNPEMLESWS